MAEIFSMLWIEVRKALRSGMPLWTALGSLFMPFGIGFLIFVSRNPQVSQKIGLISAKANLVAYAGMDWPGYLGMLGLLLAAAGFILFVLIISWVFGREFADGTLKEMLAVPVARSSILFAKFILLAIWAFAVSVLILAFGILLGGMMGLPGATAQAIWQGFGLGLVAACLGIVTALPFAFFASAGRGYLLPIGLAVLTLMAMNFVAIAGWGEYFPWVVPGLYVQQKAALPSISYWIVCLTGLVGIFGTYLWWKYADQSR